MALTFSRESWARDLSDESRSKSDVVLYTKGFMTYVITGVVGKSSSKVAVVLVPKGFLVNGTTAVAGTSGLRLYSFSLVTDICPSLLRAVDWAKADSMVELVEGSSRTSWAEALRNESRSKGDVVLVTKGSMKYVVTGVAGKSSSKVAIVLFPEGVLAYAIAYAMGICASL